LYFAMITLSSSKERDYWMWSCLNGFQSLKHSAESGHSHNHQESEVGSSSATTEHLADTPSTLGQSLPQAQISPILAQQATIGQSLNDDSIAPPPARLVSSQPNPMPVTTVTKDIFGDSDETLAGRLVPTQMTTGEHQQHDPSVSNKRHRTMESAVHRGRVHYDDSQEQMKFIKRSKGKQ
jgi:hypothetical protein